MEFLELLLVLIAFLIMVKKPEKEKLAFNLVMFSWVLMLVLYVGRRSGEILTTINL